jgi:hypothetical protein
MAAPVTVLLQPGAAANEAPNLLNGGPTPDATSADAPPPADEMAAPEIGQAPDATTTYTLLFSRSSDRSSSVNLQGQTVAGNIYVFVSPDGGITQARFFIDNTSASGTPFHTENIAPWDLMGGDNGANPYDTRQLSNGSHSITASITLTSGAVNVTTANFSVNNLLATPTPTPKPGPIYWGVNMQGLPEDMVKLSNWERDMAGKGAAIAHWGLFWGRSDGTYNPWPSRSIGGVRSHGHADAHCANRHADAHRDPGRGWLCQLPEQVARPVESRAPRRSDRCRQHLRVRQPG